MFRQLARLATGSPSERADFVLSLDPRILQYILSLAWSARWRSALAGVPIFSPGGIGFTGSRVELSQRSVTFWDHLIYAYMIENTRIHEIFRRVVWELLHGERLGMPLQPVTYQWLQTTEELFYRDASPSPFTLATTIRPDLGASRRNAYYRMFGMDLNHGTASGQAYAYERPPTANRDFVATFEEFLQETWRAIENVTNGNGPNPTDSAAIADLALRLQNMMNARRGGRVVDPNLSRDEFVHVATMSWFHLAVEANTAIVQDLKAGGPSAEERLRLIGERVGIPSHARSNSYFKLGPRLSVLLTQIELGQYSTAATAKNLYVDGPGGANPIRDNVRNIILNWSMATGRDIKAGRVAVSPRSAPPLPSRPTAALPASPAVSTTPAVAAAPATNGRTAVPAGG